MASVSSLPSRAAIAAPSRPSHSVRIERVRAEPGIVALKNLRETISASGSSMMPPSASLAMRFSAVDRERSDHLLAFGLAERVALLERQVEHVRRHHVAAHRRRQLVGGGAEIGRGLRRRA